MSEESRVRNLEYWREGVTYCLPSLSLSFTLPKGDRTTLCSPLRVKNINLKEKKRRLEDVAQHSSNEYNSEI